jgi:diaminopimelate decarboxylase
MLSFFFLACSAVLVSDNQNCGLLAIRLADVTVTGKKAAALTDGGITKATSTSSMDDSVNMLIERSDGEDRERTAMVISGEICSRVSRLET